MLTFITGLIGTLLYPLFSIIFLLIDLLQGVFTGLAGIGDIRISDGGLFGANGTTITAPNGGDGGETSTGIVYYLLTSDLVKNLFLSIMTLALILIIIFTAMAFIKNAYASKQKTWQEIVGNAFKGLANFIFIPVCCLLGVWLSNILLIAINGATSTDGATAMSRKLFICCAYDANKYRSESDDFTLDDKKAEELENWAKSKGVDVDVSAEEDKEVYAQVVDRVFAETNISIYDWITVGNRYNLFNINYLTLIVGGVFMLYVLVNLAYAMVKRIFILMMLFVISPAICAMYPIDEGAAVGNWKKEFIKYTIAAYGAVAGLNLFFSILPLVQNIQIAAGGSFGNEIFQLLIMVCGLFVVKEFMGTLSGWIGGDNAMATGESLKKQAKDSVKKHATGAVKKVGGAFKTAGKLSTAAKEGGAKGFFGQATKMGLGALDKNVLGGEGKKMFGAFGEGEKEFKKEQTEGIGKKLEKQQDTEKKAFGKSTEAQLGMYNIKNADTEGGKQKAIAEYVKSATEAGLSENEAFEQIRKGTQVKNGKGKMEDTMSLLDIKKSNAAGNKILEKEKENEKQLQSKTETEATNQALADKIAKAVGDVIKSTPMGGESNVEKTVRERAENQLQRRTNELLGELVDIQKTKGGAEADAGFNEAIKNLMSFNPGGDDSAFAKVIGDLVAGGKDISTKQIVGNVQVDGDLGKFADAVRGYNDALETKKIAEMVAADSVKKFVDDMKSSSEVAKAFKLLGKSVEELEKDLTDLAKKMQDLSKK